jgi:hypothetical protein
MATTVRRTRAPSIENAIARAHNLLCQQSATLGSAVHATPAELTSGGFPSAPTTSALTITTANAVDLGSAQTVLLACIVFFLQHLKDAVDADPYAAGAHKTTDSSSVTTLTAMLGPNLNAPALASTTLASSISNANSLKATINTNYASTVFHFTADAATIATADATVLADLITLVNSIKSNVNSHVARGPNAGVVMIKLIA